MRSFIVAILIVGLGGCAVTKFGDTFEGVQDYRIVPASARSDRDDAEGCASGKALPRDVGNDDDAARVGLNLGCYSRFQHHPTADRAAGADWFHDGDSIMVSMKMARIAYFSEGLLETESNRIFGSPVKGEIAIVASVTQGVRNPLAAGSMAPDEGKVVYYSGDVYKGQNANEFNIPVFGPERWTGGPLTIQFTVFELDEAEAEQYGGLLKTLSGLGRLTGTSTVETALQKLGTAFAAGNKDDVIGRFGLTLVPARAGARGTDAILQASDLIVQRGEGLERGAGVGFDDCYYEPLQAKVYCMKDGDRSPPMRNSFVFSIRKASPSSSVVGALTLSQLNERLTAAQSLAGIDRALSETVDRSVAASMAARAEDAITRLAEDGLSEGSRKYQTDRLLGYMQCGAIARRAAAMTAEGSRPLLAALDETCGISNAAQALTPSDMEGLRSRMIDRLSFEVEKLTDVELIGSGTPTAATLTPLRVRLYGAGRRRAAAP